MTQSWLICEKGYQTKCVDCPIRDETASPCEHAIEVAPVQHGRWKYNTDFQVWNCSECGENPHTGTGVVVVEENLPAYCPHCGVRMDGRRLERKENETEELG